ncbi:EAL domain-containing protein [Shewanella gelidii]
MGVNLKQTMFKGLSRFLFSFLLLFCTHAGAISAEPTSHDAPPLKFEHLDTRLGLNQNTITKLFIDQAGLLWVGTQDGLHSYNGKYFHVFNHNAKDQTSLSEGFITDIAQDENGALWVGTFNQGLNRLDLKTGKVTRFVKENGLEDLRVNRLTVVGDTVWIGTKSGLYTLSSRRNVIQKVELGNRTKPNVTSLRRVGNDYIVIGTEASGVFAIDTDTISRLNLPQSLRVNQIRDAGNNQIYLSLANQLWKYDIGSRHGEMVWQRKPKRNTTHTISDFVIGKEGVIWLVGPNAGLVQLLPNTNTSTNAQEQIKAYAYRHDPLIKGSVVDNNIQRLLLDDNGTLWLGTSYSGIDKINIERQYFKHIYEHHQLNPRQSNNIRALFRDSRNTLWIGMDGAGLKSLTPGNEFYQHYLAYFSNAAGLSQSEAQLRIMDIIQDEQQNLWFASSLGLGKFDKDRQFKLYQQSDIRPGAIGQGLIRSLTIDSKGQLWISAASRLYRYQAETDDFTEFDLTRIDNFNDIQNQIMVTRSHKNQLWLGTMDGLIRIDMDTGKGEILNKDVDNPNSMFNSRIRDILFNEDGSIWLATHGGLTLMEKELSGFKFTNIGTTQGLPSATIYAILKDDQGSLWISSNAGISRYNPQSKQIITFNESEGLQGLEFNGKVKMQDANGELWFGGINGINHFSPQTIPTHRTDNQLALTGYSIAGNYHRIFDLRQPPVIHMDYDEQVVSFEITSLDFSYTNNEQFAFQLDGLEQQWHYIENSSDITYTNLTPGKYTLKVRYGLRNNPLSSQVLEVPIQVHAPFYRTSYAYALYSLLLALFILKNVFDRQTKRKIEHEFETSIRVSEERLKMALWASGDGMWDWKIPEDRVFRTNVQDDEIYEDNGESLTRDIHPEDKTRVQLALNDHLKGRTPFYEAEYRTLDDNEQWIWLLDRGKVVERNSRKEPLRMTGTLKDITTRKTTENELRLSSQVLHSMNEAVVVAGLDYRMISVNPAFTLVTGFSADDVMNKPFLFLTRGLQNKTFYQTIEKQLLHNKRWSGEITIRTKGKRKILIWLEINQVIDTKQEASHFVAVFTDITDRKKAEEDLRVLASFDTLTGLPNRTLFQDRLSHAIHQAHRSKNVVALMYLDLDRFKHINDSMGHHIGDLLLKAVAARLKNSVREGDTVARLGGDEFTIIIEGVTKNKVATVVAEKIVRAFQTPFLLDDKVLTISPSIGISVYPDDAEDSTSLTKFADTAMYHAKSLGRNNFQFYTSKLNEYAVRHVELEAGLKQAITLNEFSLVYQPKFCVATGKLTGLEALLRWHSKELGHISPAEFIPLAEETGMINQIGHWVINHACHQIAEWHEQGFTDLNVAVNLSANQLKMDIVSTIEVALAVSGLPAHALELELTESMIMKKPQDSVSVLNQLKGLGLTLAVDDFGTGYSSLSYLKRFPIDTLKIDREFVGDITDDPEDAAITSAIIALAHSLELNVVAEGVETQEQLNFLAQHKCDQIQGYLLSKPLNTKDCEAFLYQQQQQSLSNE